MDGFDHYYGADRAYDKGYVTWNPVAQHVNYSRFGYGLGIYLDDYNDKVRKDIGQNLTTVYMGIAFYKDSGETSVYSSTYPFIKFTDEVDADQVKIHWNSNDGFGVYDGSNTLLGSTANGVLKPLTWQYLEIRVTISNTVGIVTMRVNESQVLNLTNQDTKIGTDYIRYIEFGHIHRTSQTDVAWLDDFYIDSSQFHGDCQVKPFYPDSVSSTNNDFTASAGNKDDCVDEEQSNEDTDYIYSDTLNDKQTFGITTGALGTVKGIQVNNHVRIDQAGTRKITPLIRSNSTNYSGTETDNIPANYVFISEIWETDPDDSNAWTQTKLEAAEFGLEITT
jgi:hypothetical protein